MTNQNQSSLQTLFGEAKDDGILGGASQQILTTNISPSVIAGASGKAAEEIDASEVTLVTVVIDDSYSIKYSGFLNAIVQGQNEMLSALANSKQEDALLVAQWKLGSEAELLHSYLPVSEAARLNGKNYNPSSGTALYDVWMDALASNVAYAQTLAATGTQVSSVAIVLTDGKDEHSTQYLARDCSTLAGDLLRSEMFHLAFIGVGEKRRFLSVAEEMGFPPTSILVADASASEIRAAINMASQSIIRASQGLIQPGSKGGFFQLGSP